MITAKGLGLWSALEDTRAAANRNAPVRVKVLVLVARFCLGNDGLVAPVQPNVMCALVYLQLDTIKWSVPQDKCVQDSRADSASIPYS